MYIPRHKYNGEMCRNSSRVVKPEQGVSALRSTHSGIKAGSDVEASVRTCVAISNQSASVGSS